MAKSNQAGKPTTEPKKWHGVIEFKDGNIKIMEAEKTESIKAFVDFLPVGTTNSMKCFSSKSEAEEHVKALVEAFNRVEALRKEEEAKQKLVMEEQIRLKVIEEHNKKLNEEEKKRSAADDLSIGSDSTKRNKVVDITGDASPSVMGSNEGVPMVTPTKNSVFDEIKFAAMIKSQAENENNDFYVAVMNAPELSNGIKPVNMVVMFCIWNNSNHRNLWCHNAKHWYHFFSGIKLNPELETRYPGFVSSIKYFVFSDPEHPDNPDTELLIPYKGMPNNKLKVMGNFFYLDAGSSDLEVNAALSEVYKSMQSQYGRMTYHGFSQGKRFPQTKISDGPYWSTLETTFKKSTIKHYEKVNALDKIFTTPYIKEIIPELYDTNITYALLSAGDKELIDNFAFGRARSIGTNLRFGAYI